MLLREYLPTVTAGLRESTRISWTRYLRLLDERLGHLEPQEIKASHIQQLAAEARGDVVTRRNSKSGSSAAEHMISASRSVLSSALRDGLVTSNVALLIKKPPRTPSGRHALSKRQMTELFSVADERSHWMLTWYLETGSRREGLTQLEPGALRASTRTVKILEKNRKERTLPVSATLAEELASPTSSLYSWTRRRLDCAWQHLNQNTEWGMELGLSSHWIRHCAITRLERASSYAIAATWAGHAMSSVTATYIQVALPDVVCGWAAMTRQSHPLHECEDPAPWCILTEPT